MRFVFVHCIVTSCVLTVTDENREQRIFPILPVNFPRLIDKIKHSATVHRGIVLIHTCCAVLL